MTLTAVPLLLLVSLILFYAKLDAGGTAYLARRTRRLVSLYGFWTAVQFACFHGFELLRSLAAGDRYRPPRTGLSAARLVIEGGPGLPGVGASVFYFFFVLLALSLAAAALWLSARKRAGFGRAAAVAGTVLLCGHLWLLSLSGGEVPYWRIDNFLVYIPIAFLIREVSGGTCARLAAVCGACFVLFSVQDVYIRSLGSVTGAYSRISVACGAVAALALFRSLRPAAPSRLATFLSRNALGLFAVHKYCMLIVLVATGFLPQAWPPAGLNAVALARSALATGLSFGVVLLVARTPLRWTIR